MNSSATPPASLADDVAIFRRFNRLYTRYIGTLQEGLLNTEYSLPEARVLYELANRATPKAKEIADDLGMDAGYLSRLLAKFESAGLLKRKAASHDGRSVNLTLTARGRSVFKRLNALSDRQARTVLGKLPPQHRTQMIRAMRDIEGVLVEPVKQKPFYVLRPHRIGDMGWVACREGAVYAEEYGWDGAFEALVARIAADFITTFDPSRERCWIAEIDGRSAGHIFLVQHPDQPHTAKLRLLFVEPSARGIGLGNALVNECIAFARTAGYRKVELWTQSMLAAAHHVYVKAGFRLVKEEPHHSFGKDLIGQTWELKLSDSGRKT